MMKKKNLIPILFFSILLSIALFSCSKLDSTVYDRATRLDQIPNHINAAVGAVYSGLRSYAPANDLYSLNEVSTDEIIVPTRGTDWGDNVMWRDLWMHSWGPNNEMVKSGWHFIYTGIARTNFILQLLETGKLEPEKAASIRAEMKTARAFYNYLALDLFGNVPISERNVTDLSKLGNKTRSEVFNYIENELKDNAAGLSKEVNTATYGKINHWFAQTLLAKLYLNAEVYTGIGRWAACIAACDAILSSNNYTLAAEFFDNFKINNEGSRENIFVLPFDANNGLGEFWVQLASLHYDSHLTFGLQAFYGLGGFNGHCSTADYINLFDAADKRRKMFLVGQQYVNQVPGPANLQYDRLGNPLSFDPNITSFFLTGANMETAGARCAKWEFNKDGAFTMSNDFAVFRLADVILMKAEAQWRLHDIPGALQTINQMYNGVSIRSRAGLADFPAAEMTGGGLLAERARELSWEGWRRNDMIRLGHYTDARIPDKKKSDDIRILYPIPETELAKNPYLKQNPGY